jgi:hypothetical protein
MKYIKTFESMVNTEETKRTIDSMIRQLKGKYEEGKQMTRGRVEPALEFGQFSESLNRAIGYLKKNNIEPKTISKHFDSISKDINIILNADYDRAIPLRKQINQNFNLLIQDLIKYLKEVGTTTDEKPKEEKQSLSNNSKEMSKLRPNMTISDTKEISNELDRLCDKYPENKQLKELQNSWYKGEDKQRDYDFWDDKIREIFKK